MFYSPIYHVVICYQIVEDAAGHETGWKAYQLAESWPESICAGKSRTVTAATM